MPVSARSATRFSKTAVALSDSLETVPFFFTAPKDSFFSKLDFTVRWSGQFRG